MPPVADALELRAKRAVAVAGDVDDVLEEGVDSMRARNSSGSRNQYSRPSSSPGRRSRVVAETVTSSVGTRSSSSRISVPLPAPEGPVTTMTDGRALPVEEVNQLRALPVRQPADGLRLADAAGVEEAGSLHAAELRHRHQDVDHLRRLDVLRRPAEDGLDPDAPVLQILLQLRPFDTNVVRPASASMRWSRERTGA